MSDCSNSTPFTSFSGLPVDLPVASASQASPDDVTFTFPLASPLTSLQTMQEPLTISRPFPTYIELLCQTIVCFGALQWLLGKSLTCLPPATTRSAFLCLSPSGSFLLVPSFHVVLDAPSSLPCSFTHDIWLLTCTSPPASAPPLLPWPQCQLTIQVHLKRHLVLSGTVRSLPYLLMAPTCEL